MIKIYPKNETKKNETVEEIIANSLIETTKNSYGYMIKSEAICEVNKMGYSLWLINGEIMYES